MYRGEIPMGKPIAKPMGFVFKQSGVSQHSTDYELRRKWRAGLNHTISLKAEKAPIDEDQNIPQWKSKEGEKNKHEESERKAKPLWKISRENANILRSDKIMELDKSLMNEKKPQTKPMMKWEKPEALWEKNQELRNLKVTHELQAKSALVYKEKREIKKKHIPNKQEELGKKMWAVCKASQEIANNYDSTPKENKEKKLEISIKEESAKKESENKLEPLWKRKYESKKKSEDEILKSFVTVEPISKRKSDIIQLQKPETKNVTSKQSQEKVSLKVDPIWMRKIEKVKKEKNLTRSDTLLKNQKVKEKDFKLKTGSIEKLDSLSKSNRQDKIRKIDLEVENKQRTEDFPEDETEKLLCIVCSELYDKEDHQPVLLPRCSHTFCRPCLISIKGKGHFPCPTCRKRHLKPPIEELPINNEILSRAIAFQDDKNGKCHRHNNLLLYWCHDCCTLLCSSCYMMDGHNIVRSKLVLQKKRQEMKEQEQVILHKMLLEKKRLIDSAHTCLFQLQKICERSVELHDSSKAIEKMMRDIKQRVDLCFVLRSVERMESILAIFSKTETDALPDESTATNLISQKDQFQSAQQNSFIRGNDHSKDIQARSAVNEFENTTNIFGRQEEIDTENKKVLKTTKLGVNHQHPDVKGTVVNLSSEVITEGPLLCLTDTSLWPLTFCVYSDDGRQARLTNCDGKLFMSALTEFEKEAHFMIKLSVIQTIVPQENPEVFLEVEAGERRLGRIYIKLWGHLRRAHHFLALCMGTHGPSYRGAKFQEVFSRGLKGECLHAGPYLTSSGKLSAARVMDALEWDGQFKGIQRQKLVVGAGSGRPDRDACFDICTIENPNRDFACPFGEVIGGWDIVMRIIDYKAVRAVTMVDVGVVLPDTALPIT